MNTEPTEAHLQEACDLLNAELMRCKEFKLPDDSSHDAIKAIARLIANQQPAIAPELVERMESYILKHHQRYLSGPLYEEARAILAELDASKPDPLVEEAEALAQQYFNSDHIMVADMALAALKRGMEMERSK